MCGIKGGLVGIVLITGTGCSVIFSNKPRVEGAVFGQSSFSAMDRAQGYYSPTQAIKVGKKFIVSDTHNNRVLIYNSMPNSPISTPDVVLGQPDFKSVSSNAGQTGPSAQTLARPAGIASDGTHLVVADSFNRRVLIWNSIPTQTQQPADVVLGEPDFATVTGGLSETLFNVTTSVWIDQGKLYVVDAGNNRVLVYDSFPTSSTSAPSWVVGQTDFVSSVSTPVSSRLLQPTAVFIQGGYLYVSDPSRSRVLMWPLPISTNFPTASIVLGQTGMGGSSTNTTSPTMSTLNSPGFITGDGARLIIGDSHNNRILIWNTTPTGSGEAASVVLGQPDGTTNDQNHGGLSSSSLAAFATGGIAGGSTGGIGVYSDGASLYATDRNNHRILVWNKIPTSNNQPADLILGQPDSSNGLAGGLSDGTQVTTSPNALAIIQGRLIVPSCNSSAFSTFTDNRVLIWNSVPSPLDYNIFSSNASLVIGQPGFNTSSSNGYASNSGVRTAQDLRCPQGVAFDGSNFYVVDGFNVRVLIYPGVPTASSPAATGVLGQTSLTTANTGTSSTALAGGAGLGQPTVTSNALFIPDVGNNRVMVWSPLPSATSAGTAASFVLGQAGFGLTSANRGGNPDANTLASPRAVATDGTHLVVADAANHRVLIWNQIPTQMGQAADVVLGQPDFYSKTLNNNGPSAASLNVPYGVWTDGNMLAVADTNNNRVLIWKKFPTQNQTPADTVLGQPDFGTITANTGGRSERTLSSPRGVLIYQNQVYISDTLNSRILIRPIP